MSECRPSPISMTLQANQDAAATYIQGYPALVESCGSNITDVILCWSEDGFETFIIYGKEHIVVGTDVAIN